MDERGRESDCLLLYDDDDNGQGVTLTVAEVQQYMKKSCLEVYVPQLQSMPGSNITDTLNTAIAESTVTILVIGSPPSACFDKLIKQAEKAAKRGQTTVIPLFCGRDRSKAEALRMEIFSQRITTPLFASEQNYLESLKYAVQGLHRLRKALSSYFEKLKRSSSELSMCFSAKEGDPSKIFVSPKSQAKRIVNNKHAPDGRIEVPGDMIDIIGGADSGDRIMVPAAGGMGKTYSMTNFAMCWHDGHPALQRYKYVFLLPVRKIRNHTEKIERVICYDLLQLETSVERSVRWILKFGSESCLILIDGYDELKEDVLSDTVLNKIVSRQIARDAVVVVTTRPEGIPTIQKHTNGNYIELPLNKLDDDAMLCFIRKSFPDNMEYFEQVCQAAMSEEHRLVPLDVISVPLFLALLCYLCKQRLDKTGHLRYFDELKSVGLAISTFWGVLIQIKKGGTSDIEVVQLKDVLAKTAQWETRLMLYAVAKMCFECLGDGVFVFTEEMLSKHLVESDINPEFLSKLGPVEEVGGGMMFYHGHFQDYCAAIHITRDEMALNKVLCALKDRHEQSLKFERYRHALVFAAGIKPAIILKIPTEDLGIMVLATLQPTEYRLDLSVVTALINECGDKSVGEEFVSRVVKASVNVQVKIVDELPQVNLRAYNYMFQYMTHDDLIQLIYKTHLVLRKYTLSTTSQLGEQHADEELIQGSQPSFESQVPVFSPMDGTDYQVIGDPILLAVLPSVHLGKTKRIAIRNTRPNLLTNLANDQLAAGVDVDEVIILPEAGIAAWQLCVLVNKLTASGKLSQLRLVAKSVVLPRCNAVDETALTIPSTTVEKLLVETGMDINEIDYFASHMHIKNLHLESRCKSIFEEKPFFSGCKIYCRRKKSQDSFSLKGIHKLVLNHVRGIWTLKQQNVRSPDIQIVEVNYADRFKWSENTFIHCGKDTLLRSELQSAFPNAMINEERILTCEDTTQEETFTLEMIDSTFWCKLRDIKRNYYPQETSQPGHTGERQTGNKEEASKNVVDQLKNMTLSERESSPGNGAESKIDACGGAGSM